MICPAILVGAVLAVSPVDGDTLRSNDCRLRLAGIDTPELRGDCPAFAADARERLRALAGGAVTVTATRGLDRYGRPLVDVAGADGRDIGARMIREGYARRYRPGVRGWCP